MAYGYSRFARRRYTRPEPKPVKPEPRYVKAEGPVPADAFRTKTSIASGYYSEKEYCDLLHIVTLPSGGEYVMEATFHGWILAPCIYLGME